MHFSVMLFKNKKLNGIIVWSAATLCGKINIFATSLRLRPTSGIDVKRFQIKVKAKGNQSTAFESYFLTSP